MAEEKDDWLDDLEDSEEKESELGQSDIDALLSGSDDLSPPSSNEGEDLGQADIDALLSGDEPSSSVSKSDDVVSGGLDQSDIEALLAGADTPASDQPFFDPDQDEIDKLFSEPDSGGEESRSFVTDDIDFVDTFETADPSLAQTDLSSDFDDHEFKLEEDIPGIPDIPDSSGGWNDNMSFLDEETVVSIPEEVAIAAVSAAITEEAKDPVLPQQGRWNKLLANRKRLLAVGGGVVLFILLLVGFFLFTGGEDTADKKALEQVPAKVVQERELPEPEVSPQEAPATVVEVAPQESSAAGMPTLSDLTLVMPPGSTELAITLDGKDPENLPLEYEFQSMPEHGQISGQAPVLVYSAMADFAGQDSFTIRATNGKHFSPTAKVTITREKSFAIPEPPATSVVPMNAAQQEPLPPAEPEPALKQEGISASNVSYTISKSLVVPWEKIWQKANSQPYNQGVGVDIVQSPGHGTLEMLNGRRSVYEPESSFSGKDTIAYRFTVGELHSATKTVTITVKSKNRSPELHVATYSAVYHPGDTVILNASQTKDDMRSSVQFRWEQISGVPVVIKFLNSEGSQISFVAPATFNTVSNPGVLLRVTATDEKGWSVSRDLQVSIQSRRNSAIWR